MLSNHKKTFALPFIMILIALTLFSFSPKQVYSTNTYFPDASDYAPLAPIEGTYDPATGKTNLSTYLTGIFKVGVAGAGVLAFLMIVWGGFTYLSTDVITGKEEGKARVERAIGGLILALASYIILNTINPKLVELDLYFGEPADTERMNANRLGRPADINKLVTDQQLEMLKTRSIERDSEMTKEVSSFREEAAKLKATADSLPAGPEKDHLLLQVSELNRKAGELDLQRVAEGEERQATANTLNAYTPEKLAAAITEAGSSVQKIQEAYAKARTEFASDPARVAALSSEEMSKIAVIKKATAFGILENPPLMEGWTPENARVNGHIPNGVIKEDVLNAKIGEQINQIKIEEQNQINKLMALNARNTGLTTADISIQAAKIHETAKEQICQIKNLCKEKEYPCHTLYPGTACIY